MNIRTRPCISLDGYVTRPDGWPVQLADSTFVPGQSHGFPEFQESCEAVLMGRWPWPNLDVFVLGSHRQSGTPDHVVTESDPVRLLEQVRAANNGRYVHLVHRTDPGD